MATPESAEKNDGANDYEELFDFLAESVEFIFSWIILLPICVIISGKYLSRHAKLPVSGTHIFTIKIPRILDIGAQNEEVIVGFTGYIITFLFIGLIFGTDAYILFSDKFGVNPGQWNSLGILSSMTLVAWAFLTHLIVGYLESRRDRTSEEHDRLIKKLARAKMLREGARDDG